MSISFRVIEDGKPIKDKPLVAKVAQQNTSKDGREPIVTVREVNGKKYVLVYPTGFFHSNGPKVLDVTNADLSVDRKEIGRRLAAMSYPVNGRRAAALGVATGAIAASIGIPVFNSGSDEPVNRPNIITNPLPKGKTLIPDMPIASREQLATAIEVYLRTIYKDNLNSSNSKSRDKFAPLIKQSLNYWGNDDKNWDLDHLSAIGAAMSDRKTKRIFFTLNESVMREYWQHRNEPMGRALFEAIAVKEGVHLTEYENDFDGTFEKFHKLTTMLKDYTDRMRTLAGVSSDSTATARFTPDMLQDQELVQISRALLKVVVNSEITGYSIKADYFKSNAITRSDFAKEFNSQSDQESLYTRALFSHFSDLEFIGKNNPSNERLFKLSFILEMTNNPQAALRFPCVSLALSLLSINDPDGEIIAPQEDGSFQLNYDNPNLTRLASKHLGFLD
jgi:hypothetical protein